MANYPPFLNAPGYIPKILKKIKVAKTPDRFTTDFLKTKLQFDTSSVVPFVGVSKRMGLLNSDGSPTDLYNKLRNPTTSGAALAKAIKKGYHELFERNEYAHELSADELDGLLTEITGLGNNHKTLRAIRSSFQAFVDEADFEASLNGKEQNTNTELQDEVDIEEPENPSKNGALNDFNLAYNINIVLPKTDDISVYNAIFKSLKQNLMKK